MDDQGVDHHGGNHEDYKDGKSALRAKKGKRKYTYTKSLEGNNLTKQIQRTREKLPIRSSKRTKKIQPNQTNQKNVSK